MAQPVDLSKFDFAELEARMVEHQKKSPLFDQLMHQQAQSRMFRHEGSVTGREYDDATDKQVAEAALAGFYTAPTSGVRTIYAWGGYTDTGKLLGCYLTEREAWKACWVFLQCRPEWMK